MANLINPETKKIVATHNHPEGIKGAQATSAAIFLARTGHSKPEIKQYVEQTFGYDLNRTCDEIRPTYHHVETCQETVPEAIIAFLESVSLRMHFAMQFLWAATATPLPASPAALPKLLRDAAGTAGRDFETSAGGYPGRI